MKAWRNGWKLGTLACSDLKCCFLWDFRKMSVLLHGAFLLKGKKICMVIRRTKLNGTSLLCQSVINMLLMEDISVFIFLSWTRPTMILYGIDNIRDLFGHKVLHTFILPAAMMLLGLKVENDVAYVSCYLQVDLGLIKRNPICRLGIS